MGPLLVSALVHVAGLTSAAPPKWTSSMAQCVLGASTGAQLATSRSTTKDLVRATLVGLGGTALLLALLVATTGFMYGCVLHRSVALEALLLAYSPGGMTEMCLIALHRGHDVAFVAAHHALRIFVLIV